MIRATVALALLGSTFAVPALAQNFPTKPITIVVPSSPGGAIDLAARLMLDHLAHVEAALRFDGSASDARKDLVAALLM